MVKRMLLAFGLMTAATSVIVVQAKQDAEAKEQKLMARVEQALDQLPDSMFDRVKTQDLLDEQVYRQLEREGWTRQEIEKIMQTALRDRNGARSKAGYFDYKREWLPYRRLGVNNPNMAANDPDNPGVMMDESADGGTDGETTGGSTTDGGGTGDGTGGGDLSNGDGNRHDNQEVEPVDPDAAMNSDEFFNKSWPEIEYHPDDRKAGRRNPGYWRPAMFKPSSGRVNWGIFHPTDPDKVMFIGDGGGLWRTDNCMDIKGWRNISDNIPERAHRTSVFHSAIPVDPDDWNHVFAFTTSAGNAVWETKDGGNTWRRIKGATHYSFKRGYCFRDADGNLKFIGAIQEHWSRYPGRAHNRLMISEDTCKTWTNLKDQLIDDTGFNMRDWLAPANDGQNATFGLWFQEFAFDPKDRNRIYIPTSRSLLYFDDGAKSTLVGKVRKYNLKKMRMRVHGRTLDSPVLNDTCPYAFPVPANGPGHMVVDPDSPNRMWFVAGNRMPNYSALYYTENRGEDWITLVDQWRGIGSCPAGSIYGNELAFVWLGGFAVNLKDNRYIYGCSMSNAWIFNDWMNGEDVRVNHRGWGGSMLAQADDGNYYYSSHARHQADNHFMQSHPSGRILRGCDGGLLIIDGDVNNRAWTHIDGNANQMLCYRVQCNEFGDQSMASNTQDIDVQFYRDGRWGMWAGYEGCFSAINPYTNVVWYPLGGAWGLDGGEFDTGSWAECVTRADVVNSCFYSVNTFSPEGKKFARWDDLGRSCVGLDAAAGGVPGYNNWGLCRDKGRCTIYAVVGSKLRRSIDQGNTFHDVPYNGNPLNLTGVIATDPDNSDILYVGQQGRVVLVDLLNSTMTILPQQGLPNHGCSQLILHEGTGDLYFINYNAGIWYLRKGASEWKFWHKGYNSTKGNSHVINYTTQEMIFSDYGRGIWVADLQRPADRFFKKGFKLKELSNNDGMKTVGIDTYWTIPQYYYYQWTVNGQDVANPYQNLTRRLKPGDKVQLKLTVRESPDVITLSEVYTVKETSPTVIEHKPGKALYSDGQGRVDLGFYNHYIGDFTVDLWVRPQSDGTIIGNRQRETQPGVKGWILSVEGGTLKLDYEPRHWFNAPSYDKVRNETNYTLSCGSIAMDRWHHIALSHTLRGMIQVYVDGKLAGQTERLLPDYCINNSVCLSLFGDGIDRYPMKGYVDEIKVWKRALSQDDVRREMFTTNNAGSDDLIMRYDFNQTELRDNLEEFARYVPHAKTRAVTSSAVSPVPLCGKASAQQTLTQDQAATFSIDCPAGRTAAVSMTSHRQQDVEMGLYVYDAAAWHRADDNMPDTYYDIEPTALMLHSFSVTDPNEAVDLTVYPIDEPFKPNVDYRIYWSEMNGEKPFWNLVGNLTYNAETGTLTLPGAKMGQLLDRRLIVVAPKPALEVTVRGLNTKGEFEVMNPDQAVLTLDVHTLQGLEEPIDGYEIMSDNGFLTPQGKLEFTEGAATLRMRVDMSRIPQRGDRLTTTLRGKNSDVMIPLDVTVVNRLTDQDPGTALTIEGGWAMLGNRNTYQRMIGSTNYTVSGWFRNDRDDWVSWGHNNFFFFNTGGLDGFGFVANKNSLTIKNYNGGGNLTSLALRLDDSNVGKWMYLTAVVDGRTIKFYLNGHLMNTLTAGNNLNFNTATGLMMGSPNTTNYTFFHGAFDQVAVWNRSLTQQEINHYMLNRVTLDSPELIAYGTMEEVDGQNRMVDMVSGAVVTESGTVVRGQRSLFPYNPTEQTDGTTGAMTLSYPAGKQRPTVVSTFAGQSANFLPEDNAELIPLNREHYTVSFDAPGNVAATDVVTLTYTHPTVRGGDAVKLGLRDFGTVNTPYATFVDADEVGDGRAVFRLTFQQLCNSAELMAFVPRSEELRAATVTTQISDPALDITDGRVKLRESDSSIPVTVRLVSGQVNQPVSIYVKESEYAAPSVQTVDFSAGDAVTFNINIDRSKLDSKALNPVTVNLPGIDGAEFNFQVYLEPMVNLRLLNGVDDHTFVATTPIVDLDIEARLLHGWMDRRVELEFTTDLAKSTSIGNGSLLSNSPVRISNLEHHSSFKTEAVEGWNLIGNPYLANINLTKSQNVSFDPDKVTKFVYTYNPATGNYEAYDMTRYDHRQRIKPFESYFIQTMAENASLTVTPVATEVTPSRKTQARATQDCYAVIEMLVDGKIADRVTMTWDSQASESFAINEDAPKFWSINSNTNQLCLMAADAPGARNAVNAEATPTSICSVSEFYGATPFGFKVTTPGRVQVRLAECSDDIAMQEFYLQNNQTGAYYMLLPGGEAVDVPGVQLGQLDTHYSFLRDDPTVTGLGRVQADSPYTVETGVGTVLVKGLKGDAVVSVFKLNGIRVLSQHVADPSFKALVLPGYYIVKINEDDKEYSVKVGVK